MNETRFDNLLRGSAQKYGIPFELLKAQCLQESGFNPQAVSPCGAMGLLQLMPGTAREMGLRAIDWNPAWTKKAYEGFARDAQDERLDAEKNLDAGAKYLRIQFNHFSEIPGLEERWKFALAAYNGGRGHINNALTKARLAMVDSTRWGDVKVYLGGCDTIQIIDYVAKIWVRFQEYKKET